MGKESKRYLSLVEQLREPITMENLGEILEEMKSIEIRNKYVKESWTRLARTAQECPETDYR
jgi:hypothetical protein